MSRILDQVLGLHGTVVYLIVGLLVFAEDALFVGFVLPGETAAILGGVVASPSVVGVVRPGVGRRQHGGTVAGWRASGPAGPG